MDKPLHKNWSGTQNFEKTRIAVLHTFLCVCVSVFLCSSTVQSLRSWDIHCRFEHKLYKKSMNRSCVFFLKLLFCCKHVCFCGKGITFFGYRFPWKDGELCSSPFEPLEKSSTVLFLFFLNSYRKQYSADILIKFFVPSAQQSIYCHRTRPCDNQRLIIVISKNNLNNNSDDEMTVTMMTVIIIMIVIRIRQYIIPYNYF